MVDYLFMIELHILKGIVEVIIISILTEAWWARTCMCDPTILAAIGNKHASSKGSILAYKQVVHVIHFNKMYQVKILVPRYIT